jgi:Protein of unknown function (DUF3568).
MKRNNFWFLISFFALFLFSGCELLVIGGAAVGAGTGTYFYVKGELKTDYTAPFDKVWNACEKTVADMRGLKLFRLKKLPRGKLRR